MLNAVYIYIYSWIIILYKQLVYSFIFKDENFYLYSQGIEFSEY